MKILTLALLLVAQPAAADHPAHSPASHAGCQDEPLDQQLDLSVDVEVTVETPSGQHLAGARIQLSFTAPGKEGQRRSGMSDDNGEALFVVPPGAHVQWVARAPTGGQSKSGKLTLPQGQDTVALEITLHSQDDAKYTAIFIDVDSQDPVEGVKVDKFLGSSLRAYGITASPLEQPHATSGKNGVIDVPAATWRQFNLLAYADGYAYAHLVVGGAADSPGFEGRQRVLLRREAPIQVTLLDGTEEMWVRAGGPMDSLRAKRDDARYKIQNEVTFVGTPMPDQNVHLIRGLTPNTRVKLTLMEGKLESRELGAATTGEAGSTTRRVYDCWERGVISGTFTAAAGLPPEGRVVSLVQGAAKQRHSLVREAKPTRTAKLDANGNFQFTKLPNSHYYVFASRDTRPKAPAGQVSRPVEVEITTEAPRAEVWLEEVTGHYVTGDLQNGLGDACAGLVFGVTANELSKTRATADGEFRVGPFYPGLPVVLRAHAEPSNPMRCDSPRRTVTPPTKAVHLAFVHAGVLRGRLLGAAGEEDEMLLRFESDQGGQILSSAFAEDGSFSEGQISPGKYKVWAVVNGGDRQSPAVEVEVRAGEQTVAVELVMPPK